ncbi:glycosyltransferase [Sphingobacterium sp. lm-10]|uniref:glycosyltransferase n=1 Tax=Sphingobacterium sp. lm-10 TaxID=2944904 RepID=UPI002021D65E|nr:glycosyltransferase [Sphingobacterium sp. lm-10]MCL7988700.1 glycosyltransferase [Sphingobacterium sp. lm-10]
MKITILTPDIPYPLHMGGNVAQFAFSDYLRHKISITYIFEIFNQDDEKSANELQELWDNVKIIRVYNDQYHLSKPLTILERIFRKISVVASRLSGARMYESLPGKSNPIFSNALWYVKPFSEGFITAILEHISVDSPDLIQVEHSRGLCLADLETGDIPKVFIHHEVQFGMLESLGKYDAINVFSRYTIDLTKNIECNLLRKFHSILTFSENDKQKLIAEGLENVESIPFPILSSEFGRKKKCINIDKLLFVGGDWHYPNYDAVSWYASELGEDIYNNFGLKLHVVGRWRKQNIDYLKSDFVIFEGFVKDLNEFGIHAIHILPIRMGGGIRTKLLSAIANFQPIITTVIGADGISVEDGKHVYFADSKIQFIDAISKILKDQTQSLTMCNNAFEFLRETFDQEKLANRRLQLYKKLLFTKE